MGTSKEGERPPLRRRSSLDVLGLSGFQGPWLVFFAAVLIKVILIPAYYSTDFDVHRNWLAIVHSLPTSKWYFENTSEWTLDYPPFFAWFEYSLALIGQFVDRDMLTISKEPYFSESALLFQRGTVILSELLCPIGLCMLIKESKFPFGKSSKERSSGNRQLEELALLSFLVSWNAGLIMVDNVHFQYNGFLFGILLFSLALMNSGYRVLSGGVFAALLNFKQIYLYIAPVYFVYLLRAHCFSKDLKFLFWPFVKLGSCVIFVFALSFGPFLFPSFAIDLEYAKVQLGQIFSRLFPVQRGLCHAYWAPNFWAIYNTADKALILLCKILKLPFVGASVHNTSGIVGLSGDGYAFLPSVKPVATIVLAVMGLSPILIRLWQKPTCEKFVGSIVLCALNSFVFGYHVHEKAILMAILPMALLTLKDEFESRIFIILSTVGNVSLFPLLFGPSEWVPKVGLTALYLIVSLQWLQQYHSFKVKLQWYEWWYLGGLVIVEVYYSVLHNAIFGVDKMQFLPLLIMSDYCTVGVLYCWVLYLKQFWVS
eukprot:Nk52_evm10s352 gene=Nk52_evmTU10s352